LSRNGGVGASVAVNAAGDAVAVWTLGDRPGIEAAARPAGGSWAPAVMVADEGGQLNGATAPDVRLAADDTAVATWVGGAPGLLRSSVRAADGSWSRPVEVGAADTAEPRVAIDGRGNAIVAWLQRDRVLVSERPAVAGAWQPPEQLSDPGASAQDVALDAAGNGFAVWNVRNGAALPVLTSSLSPVAWTPTLANNRRPVVAGAPRAGRAVRCTHGAWTGTIPIAYAYRWLRNGRPNGGGGRYRIRPRDVGARLACRVSATNAAGTLRSTSAPVRVKP
jgi:hypothetical protein